MNWIFKNFENHEKVSMDLIEITGNTERHPWEIARKNIVHKFISKVNRGNLKILDVGSGDAYLADSFTKNFKESKCFCVDTGYTADLVKKIKTDFKNKNLTLYSSLNEVKTDFIDIVTLLDVIEHVPDDVAFLKQIISQPYINNETHFIITVPAYQSLFSRHDVLLKHYRRYNLKKIQQTVNACGFQPIESGYFFSTLIIPRIAQLAMEKVMPKSNKDPENLGEWRGGKLTTTLVKNILLIDYKIGSLLKFAGINLPGLSCYMICKKNNP